MKILEEKTCLGCNRVYYYHHAQKQGHTVKFCNSCTVNKRKKRIKEELVKYKGGKCQIISCGYSRSLRALKFHHLDPNEKDFTVSGRHCYSLERLKKEVDKCILVCGNCHDEIHDGIIIIGEAKMEKKERKEFCYRIVIKGEENKPLWERKCPYPSAEAENERLSPFSPGSDVIRQIIYDDGSVEEVFQFPFEEDEMQKNYEPPFIP